jgi:hypothetical protein
VSAYKRPELPPPDALADSTSRLRARNDRHTIADPPSTAARRASLPALAPSELAPAIARQNAARLARGQASVDPEAQHYARAELLHVFAAMHERAPTADSARMFLDAMGEYVGLLVDQAAARDFRAMRESVARLRESVAAMDRARNGGGT